MPDVPFAVAGSDNGMPGVREMSPANVTWLGFLEADSLHKLYLRSRVIVVPSRCYEGFPSVVAKAMAYSRPVVATRIGAMTCIVDDNGTGLLFRVGDPGDLVEKLRSLYRDQRLSRKLGKAGREKALREYSPESVYAALMAIYEKALLHSRRRR